MGSPLGCGRATGRLSGGGAKDSEINYKIIFFVLNICLSLHFCCINDLVLLLCGSDSYDLDFYYIFNINEKDNLLYFGGNSCFGLY